MFGRTSFPFFRALLFLCAGILCQIFFPFAGMIWLTVSLAGICLFTMAYGLGSESFLRNNHWLFGSLAALIFLALGAWRVFEQTEINQADHLAHFEEEVQAYEALVINEAQEKTNDFRFPVQIRRVRTSKAWQNIEAQVLVYLRKSDSLQVPHYGEVLLVQGSPQVVPPPLNPDMFDFQEYLRQQQIYHQQFIGSAQFKIIAHDPPNYLMALALKLRYYADSQLKKYIPSPKEYALATALVLGLKDYLDNDIKTAYSETGVMHVLAVSGLHVGIVFQILVFLLRKLEKKPHGRWIFTLIVLSVLWLYAMITGLSASVLRAVVMFSILQMARTLERKSNIYNTLSVSAFLLLLYDPYFLLNVGFQLSYLAVIGIVYFYPKLYRFYVPPNRFLKYFWVILCVSVAAQIATMSLGLYYFHQFPVHFLLSNLPVIPLSTGVLIGGLAVIVFGFLEPLGRILGFLLQWTIILMNESIFLIQKMPFSLIEGIDIHWFEALLLYLAIILVCLLFQKRKLVYLASATAVVSVFSIWEIVEYVAQSTQNKAFVFHTPRNSSVGFWDGHYVHWAADSSLYENTFLRKFDFQNYWWKNGAIPATIVHTSAHNSQDLEKFVSYSSTSKSQEKNNKLVFNAFGNYQLFVRNGKKLLWLREYVPIKELPAADYLLISQNALRSLKNMPPKQFGQLIVDGNNSPNTIEKLRHQADSLGIPLHAVSEKGAWIVDF
jgi:competence protein ComEC